MATISELIIAASVDPRGIKSGLDQGARHIKDFAGNVERELDRLPKGASTSGVKVAEEILASASNTFRQKNAVLREQFFSGAMSPEQFKQEGTRLAHAFNASLTGGLRLLRTELNVNEVNGLATLESLTSQYKAVGERSGRAYARGLQQGATTGEGMGWAGRGPGLQVAGRNAAPAVVATAYGLESLARAGNAAEGGIRAATRSLATFAAGFGAGGVVITAVIAAGQALYEFWNKQRDEAEKTRKALQSEMAALANSGDAAGISKRARDLYLGTPYSKDGKLMASSDRVKGAFSGSIADLSAQERELESRIAGAGSKLAAISDAQSLQRLRRMLDPMRAEFEALRQARENIMSQPADNAGQLGAMSTSARRAGSEKPYEDLKKQVDLLTTSYSQMRSLGLQPTIALQASLEGMLTRTSNLLRDLPSQASEAGNALRAIQLTIIGSGVHDRDNLLAGDRLPERMFTPAKAAKSAVEDLWTPEEGVQLSLSVKSTMEVINRALRDNTDGWVSVREGVQGVVDAADGLGVLPAGLRQSAQGAMHLVSTLKQMQTLRKAGGEGLGSLAGLASGIGAVGAVISIVGGLTSLFKGDGAAKQAREALEREHVQLLATNNAKLAELSLSMSGYGGQSSQADLREQIAQLMAYIHLVGVNAGVPNQRIGLQGENSPTYGGKLTWEQIQSVAKGAGISLTDQEGYTNEALLKQFLDYLDQAGTAARKFGDTLADQKALTDLRAQVYHKTKPEDTVASMLGILSQFAPRLGAAFDGLSAATEEGRAKIQTALESLFEMLASGNLSADEFGKLNGASELADIIRAIAGSLTTLGSAADSLTASLLNVPSWYKVDAVRFDSAAAINPGSSNVSNMQSGSTVNLNGDIIVDARQLSADEIFSAVLKSAQRLATNTFGDSTKWSQVQVAPS